MSGNGRAVEELETGPAATSLGPGLIGLKAGMGSWDLMSRVGEPRGVGRDSKAY